MISSFDFRGKTVLITGGGRGIGRTIAKAYSEKGANVAIFSRTKSQLDQVAQEICNDYEEAIAIVGDICKQDDLQKAVNQTLSHFGSIDILINCAGTFSLGPSVDVEFEEWKQIIDTNLNGTFLACKVIGKEMLKNKKGKIVNFASLLSFTAFPERAAYASSKGGVLQLTRVLGVEWIKYGVNVNAVVPGMVEIETPHPSKTLNNQKIIERTPAARKGRPDDVIGPTLFLTSSIADFIVGQTIVVDGGWLSYGYV